MKILTFFVFFSIVSCVPDQDIEKAVQRCIETANYFDGRNPGSTCAYVEDGVRCGINELDLLGADVTQNDTEDARRTANMFLTNFNCSRTFDQIFNEVKEQPQLLELQDCIDTATTKSQENPDQSCSYVEEAVKCGIKAMGVQKEDVASKDVEFVREMSSRYLIPNSCSKTFDEILENEKNSGSTVSPFSWLTAMTVGFMVIFTALY